MQVGYANIHELVLPDTTKGPVTISALIPMGVDGFETHIINTADRKIGEAWPKKFIMGDAFNSRALMYFDLSSGSRLETMLDAVIDEIPSELHSVQNRGRTFGILTNPHSRIVGRTFSEPGRKK